MTTHDQPNWYEVLEISPRASAPVIKAAYRCLVQLHHPDKNPGNPDAAHRLVQINQAYGVLSDPARRLDYDRRLNLASTRAERRGKASASCKTDAPPHPKRSAARAFAFRPLQ